MKYVREHINEKFEQDSDPIRDIGIGKVPFNYNNLFVAKHDIEYIDHVGKKIKVLKGTVMSAHGGGMFGDSTGNILIGNIRKVNGKENVYYDIRKDKKNYIEIYYDVWEKALNLITKMENWFRNSPDMDVAIKSGDIDQIFKAREHEYEVIKKIKELLK